MRMSKLSLVLLLPIVAASNPTFADTGDKILRFGLAHIGPTGDFSKVQLDEPPQLGVGTFEADSAFGASLGFEYKFSDLVGIDATILRSKHDVTDTYKVTDTGTGEVVDTNFSKGAKKTSMTPLLLSANFHIFRNETLDFYAGPTLGYVWYGDIYDRPIKNDFTYGAVAGVDVPFGAGNWMFSAGVRYLKTKAETDNAAPEDYLNIDVDPLIMQVGVGVKF